MSDIATKLAMAEAAPMSAEEKQVYDAALNVLQEPQRSLFAADEESVLLIVRGFASEKDPMKAITDAIKKIADWRDHVGYYDAFDRQLPGSVEFHQWWPERIHGTDAFGHVLHSLRIEELEIDKIAAIPQEQIVQYQGQRLKAYQTYKQNLSKATGVTRYKSTLIIDLKHISLSMLAGSKRHTVKGIFDVGSSYFPETMWRIYLVNPPMVFRAVWAIIKPFLHPITVNKIQFCNTDKEAVKQLVQEQVPMQSIPQWMGGENEGKKAFDCIQHVIASKN